eukprot:6731390-Prymnesium_polylepis.1
MTTDTGPAVQPRTLECHAARVPILPTAIHDAPRTRHRLIAPPVARGSPVGSGRALCRASPGGHTNDRRAHGAHAARATSRSASHACAADRTECDGCCCAHAIGTCARRGVRWHARPTYVPVPPLIGRSRATRPHEHV